MHDLGSEQPPWCFETVSSKENISWKTSARVVHCWRVADVFQLSTNISK